ncbi:MAG: ribonucleoside-triphosphate reductase [Anaerolineales bacterium]
MALQQEILNYAQEISAATKEKKGSYTLSLIVAERSAFLSKQKLTYQAKFRIDETQKLVKFTEMLLESSSGMNAGTDFQTQNYRTGKGGQQESVIERQSVLFGKKYTYDFDFKTIRTKIESLAEAAGYDFQYQITAKGI